MAVPSDKFTDLDIAAPSDVKTITAHAESPEGEVLSQENIPEADPLVTKSNNSALKAKNAEDIQELDGDQDSANVKETTLGSPFHSPKLSVGGRTSVVSVEEGEIMEEKSNDSVEVRPVVVQKQEEQSIQQVDSELALPIIKKDSLVASSPEAYVEVKTEVGIENEDSDSKTETDVTIEAPRSSKSAHSLPPHMRPDFQSPPTRQFGSQDSRHMIPPNEVTRFNESSRAPRFHSTSYQPRGDYGDREQFARVSAQLMKTKHELDTERSKNLRLRKTIEAEQQQKVEAASAIMLTNLLREQAEALTLKAKVEARERELDLREQKVLQLEVYLSEGQKQLWFALEANGDRPMSPVQMEHARREAELNVQKTFADVNGKLNIKIEGLRLREAAQQMREQQYKAMVRESLEAEFVENSLTSDKADEIAQIEYNNGFGAGKEAGRNEALKQSHQRGFLEGYGACHRTQVTLSKVRQGLIARDSPELDFLYDANHPHNLWNIGELVGRLERENKASQMANAVNKNDSVENKKNPAASTKHEVPDEAVTMHGRVNGGVNGTMVHKREEPVRKMPPPRPTFAAELRGPCMTHNGHIVLANAAASLVAKETGRPIIKYENEGVNLIDLM